MLGQRFNEDADGCYTTAMICIDGVHVSQTSAHCHHKDDYYESYSLIGNCDGSCVRALELVEADRKGAEVSRSVLTKLRKRLAAGQEAQVRIPRH